MTKAPKKPDSRAKALAAMTKAELVKTIKALDRRQTVLLNRIATLELAEAQRPVDTRPPSPIRPQDTVADRPPMFKDGLPYDAQMPSQFFPWSTNQETK